jgi:hypothetical protein
MGFETLKRWGSSSIVVPTREVGAWVGRAVTRGEGSVSGDGVCDEYANWDSTSAEDRYEFMQELAQEMLAEWGVDGSGIKFTNNYEEDDDGDELDGSWDPSTGTINFNPDGIENQTAADNWDTAIHEAAHAARDLIGGTVGEGDDAEADAEGAAADWLADLLAGCESEEPESGADDQVSNTSSPSWSVPE